MIELIKIPEQRKPVLIGKDGSVKKGIENRTKTRITVKEDVSIEGDPIDVMKAKEVVKAIGRGFSSDKAMLLVNDDYQLHTISLSRETRNTIKRIMARVIGKEGSARKKIEQGTGVVISVCGKTVSIIGIGEDIGKAIAAIEDLLSGRSHAYVYARLKKQ